MTRPPMSRCEGLRWNARGGHVKRNLGAIERWIRIVSGIILMVVGITLPIPFWAEEIAETIGLLAVVSAAVGYCPLKHLLARVRQYESH